MKNRNAGIIKGKLTAESAVLEFYTAEKFSLKVWFLFLSR